MGTTRAAWQTKVQVLCVLSFLYTVDGLCGPSNAPAYNIHHARARILQDSPRIAVIDDLLSRSECASLITHARASGAMEQSNAAEASFDADRLRWLAVPLLASPLPEVSRALDAGADYGSALATGGRAFALAALAAATLALAVQYVAVNAAARARTSTAVALNGDRRGDAALAAPLVDRIARVLGADALDFEAPVVSRYAPGERFGVHGDASLDPERDWGDAGGQRLATCIVYLNDVARGGETAFDQLDLAVTPAAGSACVFFPARADTHAVDDRTTHESRTAIDEKWVCQLWRRARPVPPPLGLARY